MPSVFLPLLEGKLTLALTPNSFDFTLKGDVNGDGNADFEIFVNLAGLVRADFIL